MSFKPRSASKRHQQGFTLVEIGIVLLIIGLLLGGVLRGQELIESARVKNAAAMFNGLPAAVNGYRDRYRFLPGDDCCQATKAARGGAWVTATTGINQSSSPNGIIDDADVASWGGWAGGMQHVSFWLDLYASGFLTGDTTARSPTLFPKNPWGGMVDIVGFGSVYGMTANNVTVCMNSVPGKAATQLDVLLDDGNPATGAVRSVIGAVPTSGVPTVTTYSEDASYTVCKQL